MGDNALVATDTSLPLPEAQLRHNHGVIDAIPPDPLPVAALRGRIERLASALLDDLLPRGCFDLTHDYGGIISAGMVCHLLDLPPSRAREVLTTVNAGSITDPETGGLDTAACIGVHLARLELRVAVREFLRRVPGYRFDMAKAVRRPSSFQWGWNSLPVIIA